jgi:hypothetical protein
MREIMSIEVHVQSAVRENYGAHDWDGSGDCPQMWKNKGGDDYIISGAPSVADAVDFVYSYIVGDPNEYFNEEILGGVEVSEGFKTEMEIAISKSEMRHYLSATRVEWNSRFEKFPTNKLLSGFEGNLEENLEVCKSMMESYA